MPVDQIPTVTLDEALRLAESTPMVLAADDTATAADALLHQASSARWPTLGVTGSLLYYSDEQTIDFTGGASSSEPLDCSTVPDPFGATCEGFSKPMVVREQVTSNLGVQAVVPLTGQVAVDRQAASARHNRDAASAGADSALADARLEAALALYGAAGAEAQLAIADAQVTSLQAHVHTAQAAFDAGTLTRNDLLLAKLALSQAQQDEIRLTGMRDAAYGRLGLAIGNGGQPVRPQLDATLQPRPPDDLESLTTQALQARPDLAALRAKAEAAQASAAASSWARLPGLSGVGAYQHQEGQGVFMAPDTTYVGLNLNWTAWAWGKAAAGVKAAQANADQLERQLEGAEAVVRVDVRGKLDMLEAAEAALAVANEAVPQAAENLQIQERRQQAGAATMRDVIDAELADVRARSNQASALYMAMSAEAALARAVGASGSTS